MRILGVRCKMVYMINCLLSAPLLIWWKGESSSNSILPIQRKCTAFYWHTIQSYSRVSDTMQNGVLLPIDVHDYLEKSNFWPSQRGITHYLWLCLCSRPLCFFSADLHPKQVLHKHPVCWSPDLASGTKFVVPSSSYFPTVKIVPGSSSRRVIQEN